MLWIGAFPFEFDQNSIETETTTELLNGWSEQKHCRTTISEERNKSKKRGLWESHPGIQVGKLTIWLSSF